MQQEMYNIFGHYVEGITGVNGRIILIWIFRKWDVGVWTGWSWLRIEVGRHL
jgi:hypothetical protein